jgi:predicted dehydrogenase
MDLARDSRKVRYAVVGGGWISQAAFMPGVPHTRNSALTAVVSGDVEKRRALEQRYRIQGYSYEDYAAVLASGDVDAVYIALPNDMHRKYAVAALEAGIHVLLEKPMATSEADCQAIIDAARRSSAKLMVAYRLHFEPATLDAIRAIRSGRIGVPRLFSSVFAQHVAPSNHRSHGGFWHGPVADMAPYPINAARMVFDAQPCEVSAFGVRDERLPFDFAHTVTVMLRFPGERLAQFVVSYAGEPVDAYDVIGDRGALRVEPGYLFGMPLKHRLTIGGEISEREFPETDQFGGELRYFSECILHDKMPEPDGSEGLADVRVLCAIERALASGTPQRIEPLQRKAKPDPLQMQTLPPIKAPKLVGAAAPGAG